MKYQIARCLLAELEKAPIDENGVCRKCNCEILKVSGLKQSQTDRIVRLHKDKVCVKVAVSETKKASSWLRYTGVLVASLVSFTGGCNKHAEPTDIENALPIGRDSTMDLDIGLEEREADYFIGTVIENGPEIVGGLNAIQNNLIYPDDALEEGIEGRVFVQFTVNEKGLAEGVMVVKSLSPTCDKEAMRLIKEAEYIPATFRGESVATRMSLPIVFKLLDYRGK